MKRAARLTSLWSWLPAFRAVAEHEHLPSASLELHVSASSLSRTIRLLEADVGQPLFDRVGRAIVLNDAGRELLRSVRLAMRGVDDALADLGPGRLAGPVRIHCPAPFVPLYVLPALRRLADEHPGIVPTVVSVGTGEVPAALRRGALDLAVSDGASEAKDLRVLSLTEISHALCCGPGHPLFEVTRPTSAEIARHPFVAPTPLANGSIPDHWPISNKRTITLHVTQLQVGLDACLSGAYLAVLPWPIAERAGLRRLHVRGIRSANLYATHRISLPRPGRAEAVVSAISSVLNSG